MEQIQYVEQRQQRGENLVHPHLHPPHRPHHPRHLHPHTPSRLPSTRPTVKQQDTSFVHNTANLTEVSSFPSSSSPLPPPSRPAVQGKSNPREQCYAGGSSTDQARSKHQHKRPQQQQQQQRRQGNQNEGRPSYSSNMSNRKSSGGKKRQRAKQRKQNVAPQSTLQSIDTNNNATTLLDDAPTSATSSENSKGLTESVEFTGVDLNTSSANTTPPRVGSEKEEILHNELTGGLVVETHTAPAANSLAHIQGIDGKDATDEVDSTAESFADAHTPSRKPQLAVLVPSPNIIRQQSGGAVDAKEQEPKHLAKMAMQTAQTNIPNGVGTHDSTYSETAVASPPLYQDQAAVSRDNSSSKDEGPDSREIGTTGQRSSSPWPSSPSSQQFSGHAVGSVGDGASSEPAPVLHTLGLGWALLNVPFERRLQTLVVLAHCLSLAIATSVFFFVCVNPLMWPMIIVYLVKISVSTAHCDGKLSRRSNFARRLPIWKLFASYFPAQLCKTADLPSTRKYIFGYHPHGIISHGAWAAFGTEALGFGELFPGIANTLLTLDSNFRIPLYRDYILTMGLGSVSKESIVNTLTKGGKNGEGMGRAVTIVVGGAREALEARPGNLALVLKDRKGFIRMAMRTGADLVPVLGFGENDLYTQLYHKDHPFIRQIQMWVLRVLKFTLPILRGRGIFNYDVGMMPFRHPVNIVVGRPIKVDLTPRDRAPDNVEVDRLHGEYIMELERLWDQYKDHFSKNRTAELKIIA